MNNSQKLKAKYSHLFQPGGQLAVGDGWLPRIGQMLQEIEEYIKKHDLPEFKILQIKEKFGQLRVYTSMGNEDVYAIIYDATEDVNKSCEICGTEGKLDMIDGYLGVRCEQHKNSRHA